jgi:hypothetical protein
MDGRRFCYGFGLIVALLAMPLGCASRRATLTLKPAGGDTAYAQEFEQTYAGRGADGAWAVVMVREPAKAANDDLRQVVHLKIHWRPMGGARAACANAAIDWYITSAGGSDDLLLYQGAGHVAIDPGEKSTKVTIRSATLRPSVTRGQLADSLGEAKLQGEFVAQTDSTRVQRVLEETRTRAAVTAAAE